MANLWASPLEAITGTRCSGRDVPDTAVLHPREVGSGAKGDQWDVNFGCVPEEALMFFPVLPPASRSRLPGLFNAVPANSCTFLRA